MIVQTLFNHDGRLDVGEVEVRLLPGIPQLHVVGQPDSQIREVGIKLKSALRTLGLKWPQGHQIVVNLRPSHFRKTGSGVELAIALAFLKGTGQLSRALQERLSEAVVYGELTLDGRVFAPHDLSVAQRLVGSRLLSGEGVERVRHGDWWEIARLNQAEPLLRRQVFDWNGYWSPPRAPELEFHAGAAESLWLSAHSGLNVLLAGPQGTGKTTWSEALYALSDTPDQRLWSEREDMFGREEGRAGEELRWRPCERPHHSITPLAMVGGGAPIVPGVISRAHGGVLVMDEFLQFDGRVLEALREPVESGWVEHARRGERTRFPAAFQLVATTNLCPCGKLDPTPAVAQRCGLSLRRCRVTCDRLSGPVLDRFDVLILSHLWTHRAPRVPFAQVQELLAQTRAFARRRGERHGQTPGWMQDLPLSFRRRRSLLRVARALADREASPEIQSHHYNDAYQWVETPMAQLQSLFG